MDSKKIYSTKAEKYARYRWSYEPDAVQEIFRRAGLGLHSAVTELGAGTGILTRAIAGQVGSLTAVEPNVEMRRLAQAALAGIPGVQLTAATAESTGLPASSQDAVLAAQAVHWFQPAPARAEIRRILKPGGWLALLRNLPRDPGETGIIQALTDLFTAENGFLPLEVPSGNHLDLTSYYFAPNPYDVLLFPFQFRQSWDEFKGNHLSMAAAPTEDHPLYPRFERSARLVFDRFSQNGELEVNGETELVIGQIKS